MDRAIDDNSDGPDALTTHFSLSGVFPSQCLITNQHSIKSNQSLFASISVDSGKPNSQNGDAAQTTSNDDGEQEHFSTSTVMLHLAD